MGQHFLYTNKVNDFPNKYRTFSVLCILPEDIIQHNLIQGTLI